MRLFAKHIPIAVRSVDLGQPLPELHDVRGHERVQVVVTWHGRAVGKVEIVNRHQPISPAWLRQAIGEQLPMQVLGAGSSLGSDALWSGAVDALTRRLTPADAPLPASWLVDLEHPLEPLTGVQDFEHVRVMVTWRSHMLGHVEINNQRQPVSVERLREAIAGGLALSLLRPGQDLSKDSLWAGAQAQLLAHYAPSLPAEPTAEPLPPDVPVSIVLATLDRPDDLRECLASLVAQVSPRPIEIVVVDNNPSSGKTAPVVAEFPGVVLVNETRKGLAYARNAGFVASTGAIAIATDDDVIAPPEWVERLVAPFARPDVMVVNGNVLPRELETRSQQLFEEYGGLGRGFKRFEVNGDWFESFKLKAVPTWELGATANSAFRATIFSHPKIGLMDEALGPGMPSGVGEDTYVYYKVLKAGYTLCYEPEAFVWHKHRRDMAALRRQLYGYSKGGPGYHLTTVVKDGDLRGLWRIFVEIPQGFKWRIKQRLRGRSDYPLGLLWLELRANLAGFKGLWDAWQRVRREGRSDPYVPVERRAPRQPPAAASLGATRPLQALPAEASQNGKHPHLSSAAETHLG